MTARADMPFSSTMLTSGVPAVALMRKRSLSPRYESQPGIPSGAFASAAVSFGSCVSGSAAGVARSEYVLRSSRAWSPASRTASMYVPAAGTLKVVVTLLVPSSGIVSAACPFAIAATPSAANRASESATRVVDIG